MSGFHRRRRAAGAHWPTYLALAVLWCLLWGDFSVANAISGILIGILVVLLLPMALIDFRGKLHPWGMVKLFAKFNWDLVTASIQVATLALKFGYTPRGAILGIKLRQSNDLYMTLIAELSSLVPGTTVVDAHRLTGMLYLHVLDLETSGGQEQVRLDTLALEERVLRAFASNTELRAAGLNLKPGHPLNQEERS